MMKSQKSVEALLVQRLEAMWAQFVSRSQQMIAEMQQNFDELRGIFGDEVLKALLARDNLVLNKFSWLQWDHGDEASSSTPETSAGISKPKKSRRKRRTERGREAGQLRFSDTRQPVIEAIQRLKPGTEFTVKDIASALRAQKFSVNLGYISLILSSCLDGIEKLKARTVDKVTGRLLNIYKCSDRDKVKIKPVVRTQASHARKKK